MKIVLHICCGVCAAGTAEVLLQEGHGVTGYFFNPNIQPEEEYRRRLGAARITADRLGFELVEGPYEPAAWLSATMALKHEPEGGKRCTACYGLRLESAFEFMTRGGYDAFASTLTISPHKSAEVVNAIGTALGGDSFLARDFKKKDGFKRATQLARSWGLYRQDYCGCIYSVRKNSGQGI